MFEGLKTRGPLVAAAVLCSAFLAVPRLTADDASEGLKIGKAMTLSGYTDIYGVTIRNDNDTAAIKLARMTLSGTMVKNLKYKVTVDLVKSPALFQAYVEYTPLKFAGLRAGQLQVPFSLESVTSSADLDTINRSRAVDNLAPGRDNGSSGNDIGALAFGSWSFIEYTAGFVNGAGYNKKDDNDRKDFTGRVVFHPFKGLSIGGSLYLGQKYVSAAEPTVKRDREGLEAAFVWKGFSLKSEYIHAMDAALSRSGFYAQAASFVMPEKLQVVLKYDTYNPDRSVIDNLNRYYTFGANWFISGKTKIQVNYELHDPGAATKNYSAAYAQLQVAF